MKATLNNYRQAPRKVRLVAGLVRGRSVPAALAQLQFLPKRAALPLHKLIRAVVANSGRPADALRITSLRVDAGATLKRMRPRARGSASRINKRTSHVTIQLGAINS